MTGIMSLSCFVTCVTVTYDVMSHFLPKSRIENKSKNKEKLEK